jgi:hypothetical protein
MGGNGLPRAKFDLDKERRAVVPREALLEWKIACSFSMDVIKAIDKSISDEIENNERIRQAGMRRLAAGKFLE